MLILKFKCVPRCFPTVSNKRVCCESLQWGGLPEGSGRVGFMATSLLLPLLLVRSAQKIRAMVHFTVISKYILWRGIIIKTHIGEQSLSQSHHLHSSGI